MAVNGTTLGARASTVTVGNGKDDTVTPEALAAAWGSLKAREEKVALRERLAAMQQKEQGKGPPPPPRAVRGPSVGIPTKLLNAAPNASVWVDGATEAVVETTTRPFVLAKSMTTKLEKGGSKLTKSFSSKEKNAGRQAAFVERHVRWFSFHRSRALPPPVCLLKIPYPCARTDMRAGRGKSS